MIINLEFRIIGVTISMHWLSKNISSMWIDIPIAIKWEII